MRHNLTADEIKRIFYAQTLADAERVASEIEKEREWIDRAGRCKWHARVDCARCKTMAAEKAQRT